jgi:hypothetical protein
LVNFATGSGTLNHSTPSPLPSRAFNKADTIPPPSTPFFAPSLTGPLTSLTRRLGIYSSASYTQCCHSTLPNANDGSLGHETLDANIYAQWGALTATCVATKRRTAAP